MRSAGVALRLHPSRAISLLLFCVVKTLLLLLSSVLFSAALLNVASPGAAKHRASGTVREDWSKSHLVFTGNRERFGDAATAWRCAVLFLYLPVLDHNGCYGSTTTAVMLEP